MNTTMEEEAFKLAIDYINNDTVNYSDFKLRGLIRFSDPNDDFDNIEQGKHFKELRFFFQLNILIW